ncbi:MAG: carboxypeptidase-like regulatory domain-containing protein [Paludibacter sp.]
MKNNFVAKILALLCIALISINSIASDMVIGRVTDDKNQPVGFARISLLNEKTNDFVKGEMCNEKGEFLIDKIDPGAYKISVSMIGYAKNESEKVVIDPKKNRIIEKVFILKETNHELQAVEVSAKQKFVEQAVDKVVVNPDASITSASENVYEILKKATGRNY